MNTITLKEFNKIEGAAYARMFDDGAPLKCSECGEYLPSGDLFLTKCPNGNRSILCLMCIDPDWRNIYAKDCGQLILGKDE